MDSERYTGWAASGLNMTVDSDSRLLSDGQSTLGVSHSRAECTTWVAVSRAVVTMVRLSKRAVREVSGLFRLLAFVSVMLVYIKREAMLSFFFFL